MQSGRLLHVFTPKEFLSSTDPSVQDYLEAFRLNLKALG
jgi:hypothetical protein